MWEGRFNPSGPIKFAMGLVLMGLGFAVLAYGGLTIEQGAKTASVSMIWLILAYLLHTLGELCISPVGLSYVSKLAPVKLVGLMFGIWFIANFVANYTAGLTGSFIDEITTKYSISVFFLIFTFIPIAAGLVMWALNGTLKKKMHGIE
jgi:proton-dependent oligopeptide transporter, POT family